MTTIDPLGHAKATRLNNDQAQGIIAATCTKHRTRMMTQYYYAEKLNYLVCGTTNKSEAVQGLFVKYGDGGVDIEPIAHLYKDQVFQMAGHLGVIPEIIGRAPCPDTYSAPVTDEEWFFRMPFKVLDLLLYAWENKVDLAEIARVMGWERTRSRGRSGTSRASTRRPSISGISRRLCRDHVGREMSMSTRNHHRCLLHLPVQFLPRGGQG